MTPFHAAGPAGDLTAETTVQWPTRGTAQLTLEHLPIRLVSAFAETDLPKIDIAEVGMFAAWSNGPVALRLTASAAGLVSPRKLAERGNQRGDSSKDLPAQILSTPLKLELSATGGVQGLIISNLLISSPTSSVAIAHGFIPLTINPAEPTNMLNIQLDTPMQLKASIRPEAYFWQAISQLTGVRFQDPVIDLDLAGTWRVPEGKITARARAIQLKQTTLTNLALSDLQLALSIDRERARLAEGQVSVQGQRVSFTGEFPLDETAWTKLKRKELPSWQKANARLRIDNAKVAAFEPLFPQVLAPQGELNLDLNLTPGANVEGAMILRHARTRPLGNTSPLRDINVTLRFHDRVLALENASANLSGASVELTGRADLRGTNWMAAGLPPFALTLRGTNVPLAREPEYIIRSDLDLAVLKTNDAPPLVFGTAHLRDSFYLSDLSALVPGKVAAPSSRPPFFSIDNPTVAEWRLGVSVEGVRWLKLRTSLFNGEVSANLRLEGTLKDPIALGGLKVDSGIVRFPFANLQVQQGLVSLTSQDPYRPQLLVRASSKQFGYDIRMEVSGTVDAPIIQFTSNPSLSSEQILLMISAGQLPQGTFTLTPQQRAQTVALFLGRDVLSKLGFGDQSQERLTISSGEEISVQNRPTYHVEYKLTPRWSLTGEYDRFGDFNAGFKWRVYSK
jgi:translocation and assembly module TamB